jgi:hypothetical protein
MAREVFLSTIFRWDVLKIEKRSMDPVVKKHLICARNLSESVSKFTRQNLNPDRGHKVVVQIS